MDIREKNAQTVTKKNKQSLRCTVCGNVQILPHRKCKIVITRVAWAIQILIGKKGEWNNSMWQESCNSFGDSIMDLSSDFKREVASAIIDEYYVPADYVRFNSDQNSLYQLLSGIEKLASDRCEWKKFNSMEILTALKTNRRHRVLSDGLQKSSSRFGDIYPIWRQCSKKGFSVKAKFGLWVMIWLVLLGSTVLMEIMGIDFPKYLSELVANTRKLIGLVASGDIGVLENVVWTTGVLWVFAVVIIVMSMAIARFEFSFTRIALSPSGVLYFSRYRDCKIDWGEIHGVKASSFLGVKLIRMQIRNGLGFYQIVPKSDQRWFESVIRLCSEKAVRRNELAAVELLKTSIE